METENAVSTDNLEELPDILEPINVIVSKIEPSAEIEIPDGYVLITGLDKDGNPINHSEFFYPEKKYKRFYGNETKYLVRKNSLTIYNSINHENLFRTSQQIISRTVTGCSSCGK